MWFIQEVSIIMNKYKQNNTRGLGTWKQKSRASDTNSMWIVCITWDEYIRLETGLNGINRPREYVIIQEDIRGFS